MPVAYITSSIALSRTPLKSEEEGWDSSSPAGQNLGQPTLPPVNVNLAGNGRDIQKSGGYGVGIEVFHAGQGTGHRGTRLSLLLKVSQIRTDILLRGIQNTAAQPAVKLADIPQIRGHGVRGCLLYLNQVIFIGMNQIQHVTAYLFILS